MPQEIPQSVIDAFVGAAHGDFETVKTLLAQYPDLVHTRAAWQESAIEAAAQMGRVDIAGYLLAAGAPMDICTAAMMGRTADVRAFLAADPNLVLATGAHGIPLIYFPVITGNQPMADYLLEAGVPIDAGDGVTTPLHGAVMFNRLEMARWLLEHGARKDQKDYNGNTPLQAALADNHPEMAALLSVPA